ncbi:MAG TPA: spore protease YyaC [Candidatus Merdicola faecigallinarum]|uniref:Spore protease YyaC n=1 Tax=Candidatus Merdicola faecigallinarum TaxID=2840862 RepID=A0A9D1M0S0_9FIRM|nr:spore protease YyaC [Candidatus Merdicola faecigallinarum]
MNLKEKIDASFVYQFSEIMRSFKHEDYSDLVFLCIGTDKMTGDSFGPLVGHQLKRLLKNFETIKHIIVLGDLEENVCATNIYEKVEKIKKNCEKPYIIAIDSALSRKEDIGKIFVSKKGICVRKGIQKKHEQIGNASIKGVVAKDYKIPQINYEILQNTPLRIIIKLSEEIANGIFEVIQYS